MKQIRSINYLLLTVGLGYATGPTLTKKEFLSTIVQKREWKKGKRRLERREGEQWETDKKTIKRTKKIKTDSRRHANSVWHSRQQRSLIGELGSLSMCRWWRQAHRSRHTVTSVSLSSALAPACPPHCHCCNNAPTGPEGKGTRCPRGPRVVYRLPSVWGRSSEGWFVWESPHFYLNE